MGKVADELRKAAMLDVAGGSIDALELSCC